MAPSRSQPLLGGVAPASIDACVDDCQPPRRRGCFTWDRLYVTTTIAEFLATFFINFFATATAILFLYWSQNRECCAADVLAGVAVALVLGVGTYVSAYTFGWLRGAHFNPIVTLAYVVMQKTPPLLGLLLAVAQLLAGIAAGGIATYLAGSWVPSLATPQPIAGLDDGRLFFVLALGAMFVVLYLLAKSKPCRINPIAYGITLFVVSIVVVPATGSTLSPFHHLGVAIFSGVWGLFAIYFFAPIVGAAIAILVFMFLIWPTKQDMRMAKCIAKKRCAQGMSAASPVMMGPGGV